METCGASAPDSLGALTVCSGDKAQRMLQTLQVAMATSATLRCDGAVVWDFVRILIFIAVVVMQLVLCGGGKA